MDTAQALDLQRRGLAAWMGTLVDGSPGARMLELDGVTAAVVPACAQRSIINCVAFRDAAALAESLDGLAVAYDEAGVRAWTVWTPEGETEAVALLERAGHRFDGEPAAMHLDLSDFEAGDLGDLDWDSDATPEEVGRVNDLAYGYEPDAGYQAAIATQPAGGEARFYRARVAGKLACVLETIDVGPDCMVCWVATLEAYRGRGLAVRLMSAALAEGRERGLSVSTLQASGMGVPVYERLGYRASGRLRLYERRR